MRGQRHHLVGDVFIEDLSEVTVPFVMSHRGDDLNDVSLRSVQESRGRTEAISEEFTQRMGTVWCCWLASVRSGLQKSFGTFQAQIQQNGCFV